MFLQFVGPPFGDHELFEGEWLPASCDRADGWQFETEAAVVVGSLLLLNPHVIVSHLSRSGNAFSFRFIAAI